MLFKNPSLSIWLLQQNVRAEVLKSPPPSCQREVIVGAPSVCVVVY